MEFQPGDLVLTPKGNGYVNEVIDNEVVVDLIDDDNIREIFEKEQVILLAE